MMHTITRTGTARRPQRIAATEDLARAERLAEHLAATEAFARNGSVSVVEATGALVIRDGGGDFVAQVEIQTD